MPGLVHNFYAGWRVRAGVIPALREDRESPPPERLLQAVWQHQRLRRDDLLSLDGRPVCVLHPGFKNVSAGPDFRDAMIQVGDESPREGDVEVDLQPAGWRAHGHDRNPAFRNVILHVVWESPRDTSRTAQGKATQLPTTLALRNVLDAPLPELNWWFGHAAAESVPTSVLGRCSAPLRELTGESLLALLHQAAHVRLESKASQFLSVARRSGWEQSLWEGLFRALGYAHNSWPMLRLAELLPRWRAPGLSTESLQARMLGLSGLLPAELTRTQSVTDRYLRRVWDQWWRERDEFADCVLPRGLWRFNGLRPANHPQRRLALASHWLTAGNLPTHLERWLARETKAADLESSLLSVLQLDQDDFWSWHWTLRSKRLSKPQPLLGATRVTDLAVNVILPWLWIRAIEGQNEALQSEAERRFFAWPAAEDNARLRLARQRLLGGARRQGLRGAAAQQGLLQIMRDFCEHSNAVCDRCEFPKLARHWNLSRDQSGSASHSRAPTQDARH